MRTRVTHKDLEDGAEAWVSDSEEAEVMLMAGDSILSGHFRVISLKTHGRIHLVRKMRLKY
jgi:hypothetical protein